MKATLQRQIKEICTRRDYRMKVTPGSTINQLEARHKKLLYYDSIHDTQIHEEMSNKTLIQRIKQMCTILKIRVNTKVSRKELIRIAIELTEEEIDLCYYNTKESIIHRIGEIYTKNNCIPRYIPSNLKELIPMLEKTIQGDKEGWLDGDYTIAEPTYKHDIYALVITEKILFEYFICNKPSIRKAEYYFGTKIDHNLACKVIHEIDAHNEEVESLDEILEDICTRSFWFESIVPEVRSRLHAWISKAELKTQLNRKVNELNDKGIVVKWLSACTHNKSDIDEWVEDTKEFLIDIEEPVTQKVMEAYAFRTFGEVDLSEYF